MISVCAKERAQLEEFMMFLPFASKKKDRSFHGIVVFNFQVSTTSCSNHESNMYTRSIDLSKEEVVVYEKRPGKYNPVNGVHIGLSITDFLYLYSGAASPSDIAHMCMSGRVQVKWSELSMVKEFSESFDFSTEKWNEFYSLHNIIPVKDRISDLCNCLKCSTLTSQYEAPNIWQMVLHKPFQKTDFDREWEIIGGDTVAFKEVDENFSAKSNQVKKSWSEKLIEFSESFFK